MKRIFFPIAAIVLLFLAPLPALSASAAGEVYAFVPDGDVWFYAGETESSRVFLLPKTYYVKLLSEGETYCRVEYLVDEGPYQRVVGYCRTEDVIPVDYTPVRPYLKKEISVSYSLPVGGGSTGLGGSFSSVEKSFVYYGQRYDGAKLYYYVLSDGTFDYIPADGELAFELNTDYYEHVSSETVSGEAGGSAPSAGVNAATIVVICIACVCAVAVAVFVVRGKKPPVQDDAAED